MSSDNGLLVEKNSDGFFDVYYLVADNKTFVKTITDVESLFRYIQEEQECSILEYGTRFSGF